MELNPNTLALVLTGLIVALFVMVVNSQPAEQFKMVQMPKQKQKFMIRMTQMANVPLDDKTQMLNLLAVSFPRKADYDVYDDTEVLYLKDNTGKLIGMMHFLRMDNLLTHLGPNTVNFYTYGIRSPKSIHMYNFCVDPEYRNKGIGSWLMNELLKWCRQHFIQNIGLIVDSESPAVNLYNKFGFVTEYQAINPNNDSSHSSTMVKYLTD